MKKLLVFICLLNYSLLSCVPKIITNNFKICFSGEDTGIENILNIKGIFSGNIIHSNDTTEINIVFFKDGTLVNLPGYSFQQDFIRNNELDLNSYKDSLAYWGTYVIVGDTIKTQTIQHYGFWDSWMINEKWYEIIDRNTINRIYFKKLDESKSTTNSTNQQHVIMKYKLILTEKSLKMDNWLKNKKWFWCNEEEYKEFKKQQMQN